MKIFSLLFFTLFSLARAESPKKVRALVYGSFVGKHSLGEWAEKEFPRFCAGCALELSTTNETAGLLGKLRADARRGRKDAYDVVLGLDEPEYQVALQEKLVTEGESFDESPYAIMVDTARFPEKDWPKSWAELPGKLGRKLLIEDPQLSSAGAGFLRAIYQMKALDPKVAKEKLVLRSFPSWSSAYAAFMAGEGAAVWSYRTSEAYHRCHEKKPEDRTRYRALPLKEGYPVQVEWAAPLPGRESAAKDFLRFLRAPATQRQVPILNFMLPAVSGTPLPECYQGLTPVREWRPSQNAGPSELRRWADEWKL